jgi:lipopolysaccharide biosynthesis regulator YciM
MKEILLFQCERCGFISSKKFVNCPACSNRYVYTNKTPNYTDGKGKILTGR